MSQLNAKCIVAKIYRKLVAISLSLYYTNSPSICTQLQQIVYKPITELVFFVHFVFVFYFAVPYNSFFVEQTARRNWNCTYLATGKLCIFPACLPAAACFPAVKNADRHEKFAATAANPKTAPRLWGFFRAQREREREKTRETTKYLKSSADSRFPPKMSNSVKLAVNCTGRGRKAKCLDSQSGTWGIAHTPRCLCAQTCKIKLFMAYSTGGCVA